MSSKTFRHKVKKVKKKRDGQTENVLIMVKDSKASGEKLKENRQTDRKWDKDIKANGTS